MSTMEDRIINMQVFTTMYLMEKWGIDSQKFLKLDEKYGILEYIRLCYEPFHLTGDEGIAEEIEEWIKRQGGTVFES